MSTLVYNTQVAYNCEKNPDNSNLFIYSGCFYYAEDSIPMYGSDFRIIAEDHKGFIDRVRERIAQFFDVEAEMLVGNWKDCHIFINDYCLRARF